ncbi:TonB-dependent receptor [Novosphingobium sp. FSY-8]|uniref:TonB-dependent receptor n=1 Tax=Novosphingobium ovatum TaxID=1908523 RepID=A0ABW9XEB3_9SPHN|nr:TonB-dependent receptor [Novosphingobium ovatum]NBC36883.1 TonB-dependent receptor [Novosphingobium ovatum]
MSPIRQISLVSASLLAVAIAVPAFAADAAPAPGDIVVTGSRAAARSKLDTAVPVDVVSAASLSRQGTPELATALANVTPSIDFPRPSANDGTDAIRPATLRGLSPDQTLVLINGVRGHSSAYLNVNGTVGRGSAAVDLNTIPTAALETVEVLRDGAAAQYGSDAIAGVVNLRLRAADHGGGLTVTGGVHATNYTAARGSHSRVGEPVYQVSGWQGMKLLGDGYLTLSGEYVHRSPTNRADLDPRVTPNAVIARFGDPEVDSYSAYANFGKPLESGAQIYGWAGWQYRKSQSAAFPRLASAMSAVGLSTLYPNGFLPLIESRSKDFTTALGIKGEQFGWAMDLKASYGRNVISLRTRNSANYTYGAATQTSFYDGELSYGQLTAGLDASRKFDLGQGLNVAWGAEFRRETYGIKAGEAASYDYGTAYPTQTPGAQGFGGFSPRNVVNANRTALSAYLDLELRPVQALLLGAAGRFEHYADFGDTANGKLSARYDIAPALALRGSVSTGFRAPSLQQQYYTSISSVVTSGVVQLTGTFPSVSAVGTALGGVALRPEKSVNFSAGTVVRLGGLDITVDGYLIKVRDALALSENIAASFSSQVSTLLASTGTGAQAARFFINGLHVTTQGIDVVAHYKLKETPVGTFDFTLSGNVNKVTVDSVPTNTAVALTPTPTLFARSRIGAIQQGTPGEKIVGSVDWSHGAVSATARVSYYGNVTVVGSAAASDYRTGRHAVTDLEVRFAPKGSGFNFALGANNLLDVYPDATPASLNSNGVVAFPYYSPFGYNGRYLYARVGVKW